MSFVWSAGVTGLRAHQKLPEVAGNNPANVNTAAFKTGKITFSALLSETIKKASQATTTLAGTKLQQMDSGVGVASVSDMAGGNIVNTGNPLDLAIEGQGYFILSDGEQKLYARSGSFGVDADWNLIDLATGYFVQRIGNEGKADGFQTAGDSNIRVPYDVAVQANATSSITVQGNLSSDATFTIPQTQKLTSNITYTTNNGTPAEDDTKLDELDQFTGGTLSRAAITASGFDPSGNALSDGGLTVDASTTLNDLINHLNNKVLASTKQAASLVKGRIVVTDVKSGYSQSDIKLTFANNGTGKLTMPAYFEMTSVGGEEVKDVSITTYNSLGGKGLLSAAFVRANTANTWDMVLTSITGDVSQITFDNRRIKGIEFDADDGSYVGLNAAAGDRAEFKITFKDMNEQTIALSMGTAGQFDGLTQLAGSSTAVARGQDGYESGRLSAVSVDQEGVLIGSFSNGIKKNIATVQMALFQNPLTLKSVGGGYFAPSANSGEAVATQALTAGAGTVRGGALEKSNADVTTEFVTMIQAQNRFQANARTIRIANDVLREMANVMR